MFGRHPKDAGYITFRTVRYLTDDDLHSILGGYGIDNMSMFERELRRREAWSAPAGRALWISGLALVVSIAALAVAMVKAGTVGGLP